MIQHKAYRPDIDGLRAVAVGSVIAFHAFKSLVPGGFVGVDIFFVISGYLITNILLSDVEIGRFSLVRFYDRRIRRIFPALNVVLAASLCIGWSLLFRPEFWVLGKHVAASAFFAENFQLWTESGYFDTSSQSKPLLHLWSLAIEEQFYIAWPIVIFVSKKSGLGALLPSVAILVGSLAVNIHDVATNPAAAYYSPFGRSWELMLGAVLAQLERSAPQLLARHKQVQSFAGVALLIGSLIFINEESAFPGLWCLLPTMGAFLLLSAGPSGWFNRHVLASKPFVLVGLVSYPLYLWHWPLLSYNFIFFGPVNFVGRAIIIGLALGLATLTYLFVERPFRFGPSKKIKPSLLMASMCLLLGMGASVQLLRADPRLAHFQAPTRHEWQYLNILPSKQGAWTFHGERDNVALFMGDSQVAQYAERIHRVTERAGNVGAVLAIGGGCIPIENVFTDNLARNECWPLRTRSALMTQDSKVSRVVIGAAWEWYFLYDHTYEYRSAGVSLPLTTDAGRKAALDQLERQITGLVRSGKHVFLLLGSPADVRFNPFGTHMRLSDPTPAFAALRIAIDPRQAVLRQELLDIAQRAGATPIDPSLAMCRGDECRAATADGLPIFKDADHLNPDWAIAHAGFIDQVVEPIAGVENDRQLAQGR